MRNFTKKENLLERLTKRITNIYAEFNPLKVSFKIAGIYLILGCLWILLSDKIADSLIKNKELFTLVSMIKGWVYVLTSAALIFILIYYSLIRAKKIEQELQESYQELTATHEDLEASQEKLRYLAYHDLLTGLPNKLSLLERTKGGIFTTDKNSAALLFIDVDNFKNINDTMGHAIGDQFIVKVSERLTSLLNEGCSLYRLGGDEFIITIENIKTSEDAENLAANIHEGFKEEFEVLSSLLHISLSIGIGLYPEHGKTIEELLKYADIAMYSAKETGKNRYAVYNQFMNEVFTERVNIEKCLHSSLIKNEFEIYYQPQLNLETNEIAGFEALLRWNSPELGSVSPLKFIKVAEDIKLIIPLGAWVLRNSCAFLKKFHENGFKDLTVSINISILQLLQTDFNDLVIDSLKFFDLKPQHLELEITETILIESYEAVREKLESLSEYGIKIALDDFGKGYSSLSYLKQLPISTLKIDKSFIDNISTEEEILTKYIVTIGRSMGLCVIAEGVEKQEQLDYLNKHGCHKIQGYLHSKPLPENEIFKLFEIVREC